MIVVERHRPRSLLRSPQNTPAKPRRKPDWIVTLGNSCVDNR